MDQRTPPGHLHAAAIGRAGWLRGAPIVSVEDGGRLRGDFRPPGQGLGDEIKEGHRVGRHHRTPLLDRGPASARPRQSQGVDGACRRASRRRAFRSDGGNGLGVACLGGSQGGSVAVALLVRHPDAGRRTRPYNGRVRWFGRRLSINKTSKPRRQASPIMSMERLCR